MSSELSIATDAPIELVLPLLREDEILQVEIVDYKIASFDDVVYWLRTKTGQRIAIDYSPKIDRDEMETFISIDLDEITLQSKIVDMLQQLPYECRWYDEYDEETSFRPDGALPPAPWKAA